MISEAILKSPLASHCYGSDVENGTLIRHFGGQVPFFASDPRNSLGSVYNDALT